MGWASAYIEILKNEGTVVFRPRGNSMTPLINSGDEVTVVPVCSGSRSPSAVRLPMVHDIVLCKVNGKQYLHRVVAMKSNGQYKIGNNHGHINGWTSLKNIYGVVTSVRGV